MDTIRKNNCLVTITNRAKQVPPAKQKLMPYGLKIRQDDHFPKAFNGSSKILGADSSKMDAPEAAFFSVVFFLTFVFLGFELVGDAKISSKKGATNERIRLQ